ncbi:MAG TPA: hypothetical protein VG295_05080 [Solirubrobacteraceae bacterium]|jgi:hypothetical protein|nr:hypothetical protein [Solirubrobacteraceae bacterium]
MNDRWKRLAPLTGVALVVLLVAGGGLIGSEPKSGAGAAKVISFYHSHRTRVELSAYVTALSAFFGLFFYGILRDRLAQAEGAEGLASTAFAGAVIFAGAGVLSAGTQLALADVPGALSPSAAQALNLLENDLTLFALGTGIAVLMMAAGLAILRGRQLPAWLGWSAIAFAVVALIPVRFVSLPLAALWTVAASVVLYRRGAARIPDPRPAGARPMASAAG